MNPRRTALVLACLLLAPITARAQDKKPDEKKKPGDEMIEKYLAKETEKISKRVLDGAKTLKEWEARRPRLKQEYFDMLGLWPLPEKTPLKAKVTGTIDRDNVVIEKLHFQSKPGLYVTGNLYRPKTSPQRKQGKKLPAVLYVCGHSGKGRDGNKTAFQDHGMWFATNGYICLIIDTLQYGEVPGVHHGTYGIRNENYAIRKDPVETRMWWQAAGYTPAGVECWNGIRAIDYLVSRDDVDVDKIAVTGISGGGAATFWIAAADERVKCAVPVSGMADLESYVTNKIINRHCDCMLLINTYQWEWTTIAALVAPRPLLFANSDHDDIFPMDANRRIIARLRSLYKMYDKPDLVDEYISKGGHDYRPDLRVAIFKWINKHIKGETGMVKDADFKPLAGKELRVFPEDKDIPKDAINGKIDETFVPRAKVVPDEKRFKAWKKDLLKRLKETSFRTLPDRIPAARIIQSEGNQSHYDTVSTTEPGISVPAFSDKLTLVKKDDTPQSHTLILLATEEELGQVPDWAKPFVGYGPVHLMKPRGIANPWTAKSPPNYVERSHALVGLTVDQGRVYDIAAMARQKFAKKEDKALCRVVGRGQAGILAAYAALFEPSIKEVVIIDPPKSHRDGPIFLNVLRVLDIPDALGLLAPNVSLTLINAKDKAFDRTAAIYKLAGAEGNFKRK
jgi:cephalosporin-C deacetylase-like acetyl esterase